MPLYFAPRGKRTSLMQTIRSTMALALLCGSLHLSAQAPITTDPAPDKDNPASSESFQIPSHGSMLNALLYIAPGAGPHPVVILLHGFPGNEKNLDLAQAIRRAGWDVLYIDYRGSWGTPGAFSFEHCMEDAQAAIAYMRDPANAKKLRADPARIVLIGHSMGGMVAAHVGALDPNIWGVALISAADMAGRTKLPDGISAEDRKKVQAKVASALESEGLAPLAGCTPEGLAGELMAHADEWKLAGNAVKLSSKPVLVITSDDGLAPASDALFAGLQAAGDQAVNEVHIATDHSYNGKRIELEQTVLDGLNYLTGK
jgi:pimeloyl-ACP methyl ester carboxylesterase